MKTKPTKIRSKASFSISVFHKRVPSCFIRLIFHPIFRTYLTEASRERMMSFLVRRCQAGTHVTLDWRNHFTGMRAINMINAPRLLAHKSEISYPSPVTTISKLKSVIPVALSETVSVNCTGMRSPGSRTTPV